ncbi:MAG: molybdopterin-dependent oxidoreductase [Deltaproteobacteria bacterium]|nr:molybdopterin-dependent oxidoreductase [Deltaproteobacteria bacterium]
MQRRTFLKITGAALFGGAAASGLIPLTRRNAVASDVKPDRVVPTFCELCFWKCGLLAYVKDEQVYKLEGNPLHPLSNGKLCPRGTAGVGALYDPDRLKKPLIRTKRPDGQDQWREASWQEALDYTAQRLTEVKAKYGASSIALFSHGHGGAFFKTLIKAMGSTNIVAPSNDQCRGPRESGFELTYGAAIGSVETIDVPNAKCIAFFGTHLGENMHNTAVQDLSKANAKGATFITIDPRFSVLAGKSKYWLPIKPGTDTALLLAWANVLITEGLFDKAFIEKNAVGFSELSAHVADKTPEWAFIETGIEPQLIRETARELARSAPAALVHPGRHVVWYGNDSQRARAMAIVNALLGNWGRPGGFYLPQTLPVAAYPTPPMPHGDGYKPRATFPLATAPCAYDVCDSSMKSTDEPSVHAWIVYGCNVPLTLPDPRKTIEAMSQLDFVVVVDTMPAEVTGYADVVLPENTYLERWDDLEASPFRVPYVALRQPVVKSMYESRPGSEIAKGLADRLGVGEFFPWKDAEEYVRGRVSASKLDFDRLRRDGVILGEAAPIYSEELSFKTKSGKIELYSQAMADAGLPPLPPYEPPEEPPSGYFRLLFGRSPVHTFSRTTNNRILAEIFPENELWLNTDMARSLGLRDGQRVMLENQDSVKTGPIKLRVTERIRQDCVYMVHGFGREDERLRTSYKKGAADSRLITRIKRDPVMGGTGMNVNFVAITPYRAREG